MFYFALKNLLTRKAKTILSAISIIMATTIGLLAFNISSQVNDGIVNTVEYYDTLIGPSGSESQLVLNTMFFTGTPAGTISYEHYENLSKDSRVRVVIPFAMGDSYNGYKLVGTECEFLKNKSLSSGELFDENFEAVIGSEVAKTSGLKIGSSFVSSHGVAETGHKHENNPYVVSGILKKTNTAYDNVIFVNVSDIWAAHSTEKHEVGEEHEEGDLTAVLLNCRNTGAQYQLADEYNEIPGLQAINPASVAREIMDSVDLSKQIIYVLCVIIGIMALMIIYIMALLNMQDSKKDIKLMRLIGISKGKINWILIIQNMMITCMAVIISAILCRILLIVVNSFTSGMGIIMNVTKFYFGEVWILLAVFIFSFIPIFVANMKSFKNDPLHD